MLSRLLFHGHKRFIVSTLHYSTPLTVIRSPVFSRFSTDPERKVSKRPRLLSRSSILVQDGGLVHEVPLIVRELNDPSIFCKSPKSQKVVEKNPIKPLTPEPSDRKKSRRIDIKTEEGTAILFGSDLDFLKEADVDQLIEGLESCYTPKGVFSLLETMIVDEINSMVALQALRKIIELENGPVNRGRPTTSRNRDVVLDQIVRMIAATQDNEILIEGLGLLVRDSVSPIKNVFRDRITDEIASRVADDDLNIAQITEAVVAMGKLKSPEYQEALDSLWIGLWEREKDLTVDNLVPLFRTLPLFKASRKLVQAVLERSLDRLVVKLSGRQVSEILKILANASITSTETLRQVNKWAAVRSNNLTREDITDLVRTWTITRHADPTVEKIIELHVAPGKNRIRYINEEPALIVAIMNYCGTMRVRNTQILTGCAEYLLKNLRRLTPGTIASIFAPFGTLDFRPPEPLATRFWRALEDTVAAKFVQLKPEDALNILLALVYLEKHPVRFGGKVFRANFLDRIYHRRNIHCLESTRVKLKLFDAAMTLECPKYAGPMLPRDENHDEFLWQDSRLKEIVNRVHQQLAKVAGGEDKLCKSVALGQLPRNELYVIDALIHPTSTKTFSLDKLQRNLNTAILVHLPEHFCRNSKRLIGPQVMRKRHFRILGLRVMTLDYETLVKLASNPVAIVRYMKERLMATEEAL